MTATLYPVPRTGRSAPRPTGARRGDRHGGGATQRPGQRAANYAVRRAVAAVVAVTALALVAIAGQAVAGALVDLGGRPAAASDASSWDASTVRTHVAQPGDTLWSIAERYRGEVDQGRFVDALIDLNGGTAIEIGQAVRLP